MMPILPSIEPRSPLNPMSTLERLLYTSTATEPFGTHDLFKLLNQARQRNAELGITGHLLYADGEFTQCIEGPPPAIEHLWASLLRDTRHRNLQVLARMPMNERRFGDWSMAFSSYRYLSNIQLPGFFPLNDDGTSAVSQLCSPQDLTIR
jgi:hypothetical protein